MERRKVVEQGKEGRAERRTDGRDGTGREGRKDGRTEGKGRRTREDLTVAADGREAKAGAEGAFGTCVPGGREKGREGKGGKEERKKGKRNTGIQEKRGEKKKKKEEKGGKEKGGKEKEGKGKGRKEERGKEGKEDISVHNIQSVRMFQYKIFSQ
jgi:hypothetical protein